MLKWRTAATAAAILTGLSGGLALAAGEYGTSEEARAMLEKAVQAIKKDKKKALETFTKGEGDFKDRDLYVFCGGPDGIFTAHPTLVGQSLRDLKDKTGKPLGEEIYSEAQEAQEGELNLVEYMWSRPGETELVQKTAYVTKVDDQVCAVGYYKQ